MVRYTTFVFASAMICAQLSSGKTAVHQLCAAFVKLLLQARELRMSCTGVGAGKDAELERRTDVFQEKWVEEAAAKYLGKKNSYPGI